MAGIDDSEGDWEGWCLTEPPQTQRRPPLPPSRQGSSAPSRCESARSRSSRASTAASGTQTPRESSFCHKPLWEQRALQQALSSHLSVPRRARCVQETLEAVRDAFDPAQGLAAAAAAVSREQQLSARTPREQQRRSKTLASPREVVQKNESEQRRCPTKLPSAELSARMRALSMPRQVKEPSVLEVVADAPRGPRFSYAQRQRMAEMAKPKPPRFDINDLLEDLALLTAEAQVTKAQ
eukprot:TRINITY_DN6398_c0_g2_i1.p1 TRINITY_DN6398_c0_g2~~TRINITY_DN6398_c0_g2_i1.p1  ORF type:complete len:257 (-),score=51.05 TRINITY_DN6398_c0_g2_i1:406-1119(-)